MELLLSIGLFAAFGAIFVFANMVLGSLFRPRMPNAEKAATYECGEPTIGTSWVQFDLRFYIVALVYLVFDVEVALFYPWAVTFGDAGAIARRLGQSAFSVRAGALVDMLFFFGVLMVGFAYLWRFGYLDWVRSSATTSLRSDAGRTTRLSALLSEEARLDPEFAQSATVSGPMN
ncbi:MAG: NADH-quinone oxidoreductase subunit A [Phycisphaerae bacterium]|nr:NADH-quinone oxidoreductase subunit A [Phycisphaerae bacterium]